MARSHDIPIQISSVTPIVKAALNESPGATVRTPVPVRSAFVGAVIGSKQMNALPAGAKTWPSGNPRSNVTVSRRPPPATENVARGRETVVAVVEHAVAEREGLRGLAG